VEFRRTSAKTAGVVCLLGAIATSPLANAAQAAHSPVVPYPTVALCLPQQLSVMTTSAPAVVQTRMGRQPFTDVRATLTNVSPLSCMLTGAPDIRLISATGGVLPVRYAPDEYAITDADPTAIPSQFLGPGRTALLLIAWNSPWCGHKTSAHVRVKLSEGAVTSANTVRSPTCSRGDGTVHSGAFLVRFDQNSSS
jgi:hypothetical protein